MKKFFAFALLVTAMSLTGCGETKKAAPPAAPPAPPVTTPEAKPAEPAADPAAPPAEEKK